MDKGAVFVKVRREKLVELLHTYFGGSYSDFGRELGVDISHLHRYINTGIGGGKKIAGAIIKFCREKGLEMDDYIEF
jgi:hypothetical protein